MTTLQAINDWNLLADQVLEGHRIDVEEARAILDSSDDELLGLVNAAFKIRRKHWGKRVNLHVLDNAKSGMCRENCKFCSQAMGSYSGVDRYAMKTVEQLVSGAREAHKRKAVKYCMVTATRGPSDQELETICEATRQIKDEMDIHVCASLGLLQKEDAEKLAEAGVDRFNHNLESSEEYYGELCQTHTFQDRLDTLQHVRDAGMEMCCGGIMGMGEAADDRIELAMTLRDLNVESVPINFLDPRPGTPMGEVNKLSAQEAIRCLCMFRFAHPETDLRIAGGREVVLGPMQVMALYVANSFFTEGYLTTGGQGYQDDLNLIAAAGFELAELSEA